MIAVAVGRLHDHDISRLEETRVADERLVPLADVAGEDDAAAPLPAARPDLDHARAEDVAGVAENRLDSPAQVDRSAVGRGREQRERRPGVGHGEERDFGVGARTAFPGVSLFLEGRVLLLDMAGVEKNDPGHVGGGLGRHDAPGEAVPDEERQASAVVQVGVGQQAGVDVPGRHGKRLPVAVEEGPLLVEPAIDEQPRAAGFEQGAGARDLAVGSQEFQRMVILKMGISAGRRPSGPPRRMRAEST